VPPTGPVLLTAARERGADGVATSHTLTVWRAVAVASVRPSGENAMRSWNPGAAVAAMEAIRCGVAGLARSHSTTALGQAIAAVVRPGDGRLDGETAIVTGGAAGIGRAVAMMFAAEGAQVAIGDIDGQAAAVAAGAIRRSGGKALAVQADVSDEASVTRTAQTIAAQLGVTSILVNNAAGTRSITCSRWAPRLAARPAAHADGPVPVHPRGPARHARRQTRLYCQRCLAERVHRARQ
jgi:hypothetical protein